MCIQVEKNLRAYVIGSDCGFFRVPAVLEFDEITGRAVFERLKV